MRNRPDTTLALFARGREIGFAVFGGAELIRFGVRSIRGSRRGATFEKRVAEVLDSLMRLAGSDSLLVLEGTPPPTAENGSLSRALRVAVEARFDKNAVRRVALAEAKRLLCGSASATQSRLIAAVAERHPVCRLPETPNRVGVKPYGLVGVLAVALAEAFSRRQDAGRGEV